MQAINAVYSRNNLTMFSTSIIQASRGLPEQALNAVYSQLNYFRTSLSVIIKLCRFAEVPPPYFFPFSLPYSLFMAFLLFSFFRLHTIKPFTSISRRQTVDVVQTSVVPCSPLRLADRWSCWQRLPATTNWAPAVHCRGLHAVAWCRRQTCWRSRRWNSNVRSPRELRSSYR